MEPAEMQNCVTSVTNDSYSELSFLTVFVENSTFLGNIRITFWYFWHESRLDVLYFLRIIYSFGKSLTNRISQLKVDSGGRSSHKRVTIENRTVGTWGRGRGGTVCRIGVKVAVLCAQQFMPWNILIIKVLNNFWYFKYQIPTRTCSKAHLKRYWRNCLWKK